MVSILDPSYQEVEYIESTGTQYINTGVNVGPGIVSELDWQVESISNTASGWSVLYGYASSSSGYPYALWGGASAGTLSFYRKSGTSIVTIALPTTRAITTLTSNADALDKPIYIFSIGPDCGGYKDARNPYKLYGLKIYNNSTLVRHFVPCYRKSDNAIGMYDMVSKTFYGNSGTGNFEKGPEVHEFVTYKTVIYNAIKGFNDIQNTLSNLSDLSIAATSGGNNAIAVNDIVRNINKCATVKKNDGSFVVGKIPVYSPADDGGK